MKKITALLLALCLIFVTACGSASPSDALKADLEDAKKGSEQIQSMVGSDGFGEEATKALVDKVLEFEYELGEEKVDGDTATVETTITTYPFGDIFTDVMTEFMEEAMSGGEMSDDDMTKLLDDLLMKKMDSAEKNYEKTITVTLKKDGKDWVVQESDELSNALTGGLLDFANNAMSSLGQ